MRAVLAGVFLSGLLLSAGLAADDMMAGYYGNTVISTGGPGESHSYFSADHSFVTKFGSLELKGTWMVDDKGQLCRTYAAGSPAGIPSPLCTAWSAHKVGDSWSMTLGSSTRQMRLVAGIR